MTSKEPIGFRKLKVWDKGMDLVGAIYLATDLMPESERFGLVSQMQRAAVSAPSNIAEGYARSHLGDYLKRLSYARDPSPSSKHSSKPPFASSDWGVIKPLTPGI